MYPDRPRPQGSVEHPRVRLLLIRWVGWFLVINTMLLVLISTRYWMVLPRPETLAAWLFLSIAFPSHLLTLAAIPACLIALLVLIWPRLWLVLIAGAILFGLLLVLLLIDTVVFCLFRFHLNGMVWSLIINGGLDQILPLSLWTWALGLILPLLAFGLELGLGVWIWRWVSRSARLCCLLIVAGIILAVIENTAYAWAEAVHYTAITKYVRVLPGYPPLSPKRRLVKLGLIEPTAEAGPVIPVAGSSLN